MLIAAVPGSTLAPGALASEQPFYQQVWFIAVVAIACLIILFVGLACCLRSTRQKVANM